MESSAAGAASALFDGACLKKRNHIRAAIGTSATSAINPRRSLLALEVAAAVAVVVVADVS